jgi:quercetin dioxygenase-like cupin family protein
MTRFTATALSLLLGPAGTASASAEPQGMTVTRSGSQPSNKGSDQYFTGSVRVDPLFQPKAPSRVSGAYVSFEPGARSAWHTHPLGQTLIVTAGTGWVQEWNGEKQEIRPGDVVWTPPGVKHWHGATATSGMTHIAIQESLDGKNVEWMEKVSDEQYGKTASAPGPSALPSVAPRLGDVGAVSPALEEYTQRVLRADEDRGVGNARATGLLCRLAERVLGASGREKRLGEAAGSAAARKSRVDHETETDRRRQGRHRHLGRQRNRTGLCVPHAHDADDG